MSGAELAITIRLVSNPENLDGSFDRPQARTSGQDEVKAVTRRHTVLVSIAPNAVNVVIAFPDGLLPSALVERQGARTYSLKLGKNTIFFGANTAYRQVRYADVNSECLSSSRHRLERKEESAQWER
jgi:hypothetical protein